MMCVLLVGGDIIVAALPSVFINSEREASFPISHFDPVPIYEIYHCLIASVVHIHLPSVRASSPEPPALAFATLLPLCTVTIVLSPYFRSQDFNKSAKVPLANKPAEHKSKMSSNDSSEPTATPSMMHGHAAYVAAVAKVGCFTHSFILIFGPKLVAYYLFTGL